MSGPEDWISAFQLQRSCMRVLTPPGLAAGTILSDVCLQEPSKSLMEKHQETLAERAAEDKRKARDQKRKREAAAGDPMQDAEKQPDWVGKSAWRPWDREKDLEIPKALTNSAPPTSLASRFKPASS